MSYGSIDNLKKTPILIIRTIKIGGIMKQVINILKLKTDQEIDEVANHNLRQVPSRNVNSKLSHKNKFYIGSPGTNTSAELSKKLAKVPKFRKDANKMVNLVLSASPEFFQNATKKQVEQWENSTQKWVEDTFGKDNIIYSVVHHDEKTPHFHVAIVPIFEGKLRSNHWFDGPAKLNTLHNSYAKISKQFGINRGQKAVKSSQTEIENFYKKVNASTAYERELDRKLDILFEKLENPTLVQKLTPWTFVDNLVKPFVAQLNKNLSHYRTRAKNSEQDKKDLANANQRVADLELKMETLGIDPDTPFLEIEKMSYEVKSAVAEKSRPSEEIKGQENTLNLVNVQKPRSLKIK